MIHGSLDRKLQTNSGFSLPFPVSQKLQHSDGSPVERCHCSEVQVQFEHLSERWSEIILEFFCLQLNRVDTEAVQYALVI